VLANRLDVFWAVDWEAVPANLASTHSVKRTDILIVYNEKRNEVVFVKYLKPFEARRSGLFLR
jgi:hypothetical protein